MRTLSRNTQCSNGGEVSVPVTHYSIFISGTMEVLVSFNNKPLTKLTVVALRDLIAQRDKRPTSRLSKKELISILSELYLTELLTV